MPQTALVRKLCSDNRLDDDDIKAIEKLPLTMRVFAADYAIITDGDRPDSSCLVVEGFLYRSKHTQEGQRQILSLHIPGEIPDLQSLHLRVMDHDLTTLTECTVGFIHHDALRELNKDRPNVAAALWRETLIDSAIFREWILNVGRREALARLAHLILEMRYRLEVIGLVRNERFELPITQAELGDCMGLSTVHTNRVLQQLRGDGVIEVGRGSFHVLDRLKLESIGQFDPTYLHQQPSL